MNSPCTTYSQQTSFEAEHLLAHDLTASASYLFVRGVRLSRTRNINLPPPGSIFGTGYADPHFTDIYQLEDSANSTYQGVSFVLNRHMSDELEFTATIHYPRRMTTPRISTSSRRIRSI
jgi:hypothetical protein